ncbi:MAG: hypothetical protein ACE5NC_10380, partial [Anaerolineae bacterium]
MRKYSILMAVIVLAVLASVAVAQESITITLDEESSSGQSGTAVLTAMGSQTEVVVDLGDWGPEGAGVEQPIHIHSGQCGATLGGVSYALTNLSAGASTTVVDATLESLQTGDFAINAHQSGPNAAIYTACGNIPAAALPTTGGV